MKKMLIPVCSVILISCLLSSCLFGINGSGKVVKSERQVAPFTSISASAGLEIILMQDSIVKVVVEADDNLQEIIKTEVSNGELKIYPKQQIGHCKSKKIVVTFKTIHALDASSGSEIISKMVLKIPSLHLSASSGANADLMLEVTKLNVDASSGGNIRLSGITDSFDVDASSGANIKATDIVSKSCNAGASSGGNVKVFATEKINAQASSGGFIKVKGSPKERNIQKSSGGNIDLE